MLMMMKMKMALILILKPNRRKLSSKINQKLHQLNKNQLKRRRHYHQKRSLNKICLEVIVMKMKIHLVLGKRKKNSLQKKIYHLQYPLQLKNRNQLKHLGRMMLMMNHHQQDLFQNKFRSSQKPLHMTNKLIMFQGHLQNRQKLLNWRQKLTLTLLAVAVVIPTAIQIILFTNFGQDALNLT